MSLLMNHEGSKLVTGMIRGPMLFKIGSPESALPARKTPEMNRSRRVDRCRILGGSENRGISLISVDFFIVEFSEFCRWS